MRYTITFDDYNYETLIQHLFYNKLIESAAYALCKLSVTDNEQRLLVREIIPVMAEDIEEATATRMKISSRSFLRAMKTADNGKYLFVFIHSHPTGIEKHSKQDDLEEKKLFKTAYNAIGTNGIHGSIVFSTPDKPSGRIWLRDGTVQPLSLVRVIGKQFKFYTDLSSVDPLPVFFDRQIRAFGNDIQKLLQTLHVGIIGAGGTGSSVAEQLIRLGVGKLTISDGQTFEETNINRVYGSRKGDEGEEKEKLIERLADQIALGTEIQRLNGPVTFQSIAKKIKECDIVFGCTDDQWGRSILTRLSVYYQIPIFDMGVRIHSHEGIIKSIQGRVTTLYGNQACLFCRDRITTERITAESIGTLDPSQLKQLQKEGYAPELEETAPSVIPFTTNIASVAISEFLHRLTGFMGAERMTNEVLILFDRTEIGRNSRLSKSDCFCGDRKILMRGDTKPLLDLTWRQEQ